MVQTLAAAGEPQRDLQRELTYDGLRAAEAKGNKGGRHPAVPAARPPPSARRRPLDGGQGVAAVPAQCKARREYECGVSSLAPIEP
ncbi:hypothetical protein [Streptomyces albus]|uniref:hypothetical protein n=1 Tax=Streptomyces albus TaxID=1888 RepID=UPI0033FD4102